MSWFRWFMAAVVGICAGIWETALLPFLPNLFAWRPVLPIAVILLVSSSREKALVAAIAGAVFLDAYGWSQTDFAILRYVLIILLLSYVSERFLTNRSVYATAALAVLARILDMVSSAVADGIGFWLGFSSESWQWPQALGWTLVWDAATAALAFLLIAAVTKRFVTMARSDYRF